MALIYEHWRPDTNECFYVGASRDAEDDRPYNYGCHNDDYDVVVAFLKENGMKPFTKLIWTGLPRDCTGTFEKLRIAYQRAILGNKLTNIANGGDGFNINWSDTKFRLKFKNAHNTEEAKNNHSYAAKEVAIRPEVIEKRKIYWSSSETRSLAGKKTREAQSKPEVKAKHKMACLVAQGKEEQRVKNSKAQLIAQNRPEVKAKHSQINSLSEVKLKRSEGQKRGKNTIEAKTNRAQTEAKPEVKERRKLGAQRRAANETPQQRSERAFKAWETKRRNKLKGSK
jgi:hypothetical protein